MVKESWGILGRTGENLEEQGRNAEFWRWLKFDGEYWKNVGENLGVSKITWES